MNHAELSRRLALAIGWQNIYPVSLETWKRDCVFVAEHACPPRGLTMSWRPFDYRDPTVALPVLAWLMREHWAIVQKNLDGKRAGVFCAEHGWCWADTLEEAIARAVIAVGGK